MIGRGTLWVVAWAAIALGASTSSAQEQWLAYRSSPNPESVLGATGGRSEETSGQLPQGVALPTFKTDKPLFFCWRAKSPVGPSKDAQNVNIWFALDRSRQNGPYDLLYVDANHDGSLADQTPLQADEARSQSDYEQSRFNLVKVLLPGEDGPTTYHLNIQYRAYQGNPRTYLMSACWYEGNITAGGKQVWCAVIDGDANGRFDDTSLRYDKADRIRIADKAGEPYKGLETDTTLRPLAKHVEIDGKLFAVTVAGDGSSITLSPPVDIPTGTIRMATSLSQVNLFGAQGYFVRPVTDGVATLPEGRYSLVLWRVSRKDDKGAAWALFGGLDDTSKAPKVTVIAGKQAALDIGEPLVSTITCNQDGQESNFRLELKGRHGEAVRILRSGEQSQPPKLRIANRSGTYDKAFSMQYG